MTTAFEDWAYRWMTLAQYNGPDVDDREARIDGVLRLWNEPIPGNWRRGPDKLLLNREVRCRRAHGLAPPGPEHALEHALLVPPLMGALCLGRPLEDGINAVSLVRDGAGGRAGNVEADVLLLAGTEDAYSLLLVEVKVRANNAWYAVVENLRQLRLFRASQVAQQIFHTRMPELVLPDELPVTALVLAPTAFYAANGKQRNAVAPAQELLRRIRETACADARLATWDAGKRAIELLST